MVRLELRSVTPGANQVTRLGEEPDYSLRSAIEVWIYTRPSRQAQQHNQQPCNQPRWATELFYFGSITRLTTPSSPPMGLSKSDEANAQRSSVPIPPPESPTLSEHPDRTIGTSRAEPCSDSHDAHCVSLRPRAYHFIARIAYSASRSSVRCATVFFSRPLCSYN